jgi:hypothetical protein
MTLSIAIPYYYAEGSDLFIVMLNVIMLSVVMLSVVAQDSLSPGTSACVLGGGGGSNPRFNN